LSKIVFLFILFGFTIHVNAQSIAGNNPALSFNTDSLNKIYGKHKQFLKEYELPSLIALSCFPELIHERIKFKFSSINSTASTTVNLISVLKKINKQYIIYINNNIQKTGMLLYQAPFDAQVGAIAHELAHILDFKNRNFLAMALWGTSYLFVPYHTKIEKRTDKMVIRHGLGCQLYSWADFVINHSTSNKRYLKIKQTRYLLPNEIKEYMNNLNATD
jgi:hypothetical protein